MQHALLRYKSAVLLRPLLSRLPRAYGMAYRIILGPIAGTYRGDALLKKHLARRNRVFYDRHLDCYVLADVGDAASRNHYILGRYYETFVPLTIRALLRAGDTFVDIGANRGIHTMFASRYLNTGRVIAFEPNPRTFRVLQAHLTINNLTNCAVHNMGLSDENGVLSLNLFEDDAPSGCSFIDKGENPVKEHFNVPVRRLDEVLGASGFSGRTLVKTDTEGFDHKVIRGMGKLLEHDQLAILTEVVDDWLKRAGSSAQALFDDMRDRGFKAYLPTIRSETLRQKLHLELVSTLPGHDSQFDLLFAKPGMVAEPA